MVVEKLAHWEKLKALVLDSVSSPITKRVYNMALNEFLAWFQQTPRPGFTKATVSAWRVSLDLWQSVSFWPVPSPEVVQKASDRRLFALPLGLANIQKHPYSQFRPGQIREQIPRVVKLVSANPDAPPCLPEQLPHHDARVTPGARVWAGEQPALPDPRQIGRAHV